MNGQLDIQTSGSDWGSPIQAMLHERAQADTTSVQFRDQRTVLHDFERQMASFEAEREAQIVEVQKHYIIAKDPLVATFLHSNRALSQLLLEAVPHLRRHFGPDAVLRLRAPVDASGAQTLYAVVMWPGAVDDVRAALANFDNGWWFGMVRRASGNLTFTYELI